MNGDESAPVRVLIVDDHPVFRRGMTALLKSVAGMEVVGEASSGREAVSRAVELQPDVVLMDIKMPDMTGIDATREIARACPESGTLMVTMLEDDDSVFAAMRAGARGYVLKGATQDEVVRAIRVVASGDAIFGASLARRLGIFFAGRERSALQQAFPDLSPREAEILELMARGVNNRDIARRLVVSEKTVRNHVSAVLNKVQAADRAEAIVRAREAGLE